MSNQPTPSAQLSIKVQAPKDIIQFRDLKNNVLTWFDCTGAYHYLATGQALIQLPRQRKYLDFRAWGTPGSLLILYNDEGQAVGWPNGDGTPGGSLAGITGRPIGWMDSNGVGSGNGPMGGGAL